jgi:hypothetical protein
MCQEAKSFTPEASPKKMTPQDHARRLARIYGDVEEDESGENVHSKNRYEVREPTKAGTPQPEKEGPSEACLGGIQLGQKSSSADQKNVHTQQEAIQKSVPQHKQPIGKITKRARELDYTHVFRTNESRQSYANNIGSIEK